MAILPLALPVTGYGQKVVILSELPVTVEFSTVEMFRQVVRVQVDMELTQQAGFQIIQLVQILADMELMR